MKLCETDTLCPLSTESALLATAQCKHPILLLWAATTCQWIIINMIGGGWKILQKHISNKSNHKHLILRAAQSGWWWSWNKVYRVVTRLLIARSVLISTRVYDLNIIQIQGHWYYYTYLTPCHPLLIFRRSPITSYTQTCLHQYPGVSTNEEVSFLTYANNHLYTNLNCVQDNNNIQS